MGSRNPQPSLYDPALRATIERHSTQLGQCYRLAIRFAISTRTMNED
jgi:hypothetical protein